MGAVQRGQATRRARGGLAVSGDALTQRILVDGVGCAADAAAATMKKHC